MEPEVRTLSDGSVIFSPPKKAASRKAEPDEKSETDEGDEEVELSVDRQTIQILRGQVLL